MFKNILFKNNQLKSIFIFIIFILGLYYVINQPVIETFEKNTSVRCPNLLIQRGSTLYLSNTKLANVPGVNPIKFNNLDEYVEFSKWQRSQGIRCPVLYLQEVYDTQGKRVYKSRPSPENPQSGLPDAFPVEESKLLDAGRDDPPFNKNSYPGYDQQSQYIGLRTPLDNMFNSNTRMINADYNKNSYEDSALYVPEKNSPTINTAGRTHQDYLDEMDPSHKDYGVGTADKAIHRAKDRELYD